MDRELDWLRKHHQLAGELARERNLSELLPRVLDAAIEITEAERGFLVLVGRNEKTGKTRLKVEVARGFDKANLLAKGSKVSRTVVTRVLDEDRGLVTTDDEDMDLLNVTSVRERRVRSILCVPLRLRGTIRGVVYLDHRFDRQAFTKDDLPAIEAFADHAALALETAELASHEQAVDAELNTARRELEALSDEGFGGGGLPTQIPRFGEIVGNSASMLKVYDLIERSARSDAPVLVSGESGVGKELVAQELHRRSERAQAPLIRAVLAGSEELESELFGHVEGAFEAARTDRLGFLREAAGGTLVLEEVSDLPLELQRRLVLALAAGSATPLGGREEYPLRCRLVATTLHDLRAKVESGEFREDLFYRLDVLRIRVPALRDRPQDLPALVAWLLEREGLTKLQVSPTALARLCKHSWPGNVRELENEIRRWATLRTPALEVTDLSLSVQASEGVEDLSYAGKTLGEVEAAMVARALKESQGNKSAAARLLKIPRSTLQDLIQRYGL